MSGEKPMRVKGIEVSKEQVETAKENGVSRVALYNRIYGGRSVESSIQGHKLTNREYQRKYTDEELELAEKSGVSMNAVGIRIHLGWDKKDALTYPMRKKSKDGSILGGKVTASQKEQAKMNGVSTSLLHYRVKSGWDVEEAISKAPRKNNAFYDPDMEYEEIEEPYGSKRDYITENDVKEAIATIARIKHLNQNEFKDDPITFPKNDIKKLEAMNMTIHDVEARI